MFFNTTNSNNVGIVTFLSFTIPLEFTFVCVSYTSTESPGWKVRAFHILPEERWISWVGCWDLRSCGNNTGTVALEISWKGVWPVDVCGVALYTRSTKCMFTYSSIGVVGDANFLSLLLMMPTAFSARPLLAG